MPPAKVADVLGLMGDSIDNIPGVPGIGEKGARALIQEYGSLEALLERAGEIKRKAYREGLLEHREQALLSKELSTIHTDLELPFDPEALRHDEPDPEALRRLFTELEFFSLVEELKATTPPAGQEVGPAEELTSAEAWAERAVELAGKEIFVALLGEERPIGLAVGEEGDGPVWYADFRRDGTREAALGTLAGWVADPDARLSGHNLKEVLRLVPEGAVSRARLFDAMLVSYLLKPSVHGHTLDELALERLQCKPLTAKEAGWDKAQDPPIGDSRLACYACERVTFARRMAGAMREELAAAGSLARVYSEIEIPLLPVLLGMEEAGIRLDTGFLQAMSAELGKEMAELEEEVYRQAGERFNINSPLKLGLDPVREDGAAGPQADAEDEELLDRRRDAGGAGGARLSDRRVAAALPRADQAQVDLRRCPADAGRRGRPAAHPLQPGGGGDRAAVVDEPQPAEHPDPHGARAAHPARLRGRAGERPAGGGLQPGGAAHPGPHRRGAGAGPRLCGRRGHPPLDGGGGLRRSRRTW